MLVEYTTTTADSTTALSNACLILNSDLVQLTQLASISG